MKPRWVPGVHMAHLKVGECISPPRLFLAACGATLKQFGTSPDELPRCSKCEAAEKRAEAAERAAS